MTDYERLLKKYEKAYVPGEKHSLEYIHNLRVNARLKHRMLLVDKLSLEVKYFFLTPSQKATVKYLVRVFNENFKDLHRQASDETIILAFIFYLKKLDTPKLQLKNYKITKKYNLTDAVFELILCRITNYFMIHHPVYLTTSVRDDHDKLVREGEHS